MELRRVQWGNSRENISLVGTARVQSYKPNPRWKRNPDFDHGLNMVKKWEAVTLWTSAITCHCRAGSVRLTSTAVELSGLHPEKWSNPWGESHFVLKITRSYLWRISLDTQIYLFTEVTSSVFRSCTYEANPILMKISKFLKKISWMRFPAQHPHAHPAQKSLLKAVSHSKTQPRESHTLRQHKSPHINSGAACWLFKCDFVPFKKVLLIFKWKI